MNAQMKEVDPHEIYEIVRKRICLFDYEPGAVISENALATEFGVSRSVMRRIMWNLESDWLIRISKGSGAVVTYVDIRSLKEVYVVRQSLIELLAELKPAQITEEIITNLEAILQQTEEMQANVAPRALAELYYHFHQEMLKIIRNTFLKEITDKLYHLTSRVWLQLLPDLDWNEEVEVMCDEIRSVIDALRDQDMATVARVRHEHMAMLLRRINNYLAEVQSV
jgi:DNA-binding GntR family transcriptional regulator